MWKLDDRTTLRRLERDLATLRSASQLRRLEHSSGIDVFSNDYLGLSTHPRLKEAIVAALAAGLGVGSTGSRLLSGNAPIWEELEAEFAAFLGTEAALFFNSGYAANLGLLTAVLRPEDLVFSDECNHASLIDGIRLSRAHKVVFPHSDLDFLEDHLRASSTQAGRKFIVVESVFSMEGDRAPLEDLLALADRYGADLIVDEAHAIGVFGPEGRGLVALAGGNGRVLATLHTCGKALASAGAFVCGSETLKQYLVNHARTFIFSTALPPYIAAQVRAAMTLARAADDRREKVAGWAAFLRGSLQEAGFSTGRSDSQIVPVVLGQNGLALDFAEELRRQGFEVRAIRPPSVPAGTARLRLSVNAKLSAEVLQRLVEVMRVAQDRVRAPARP